MAFTVDIYLIFFIPTEENFVEKLYFLCSEKQNHS